MTLAQSEGSIMLTLRNPMDRKQTETVGVRTAALLGQPPAPAPRIGEVRRVVARVEPAPAPQPPPQMYTVEAIRAAKRTAEVVK